MKAAILDHLIFASALACFLGTAGAARPDAVNVALAGQSRALTAAIEHGDAGAVALLFTTDARLSVPGINDVLVGREAIQKFWQSALGGGLKSLELTPTELLGDGQLRVETGSYTAFGANRSEFGRGQYLFVWMQEGGAWKISRDYAHPIGVQPGGAQPAGMPSSAAAAGKPEPDRVGLPHDYLTRFRMLGTTLHDPNHGLTTVYANDVAASALDSSHYPNGSVILMEFAEPQKDGEDQLLRDAHGQLIRGPIAHIDVMRREAGYGESYGANRAGEWEFASYRVDGSTRTSAAQGAGCAGCHLRAGAEKDFVFRTRSWSDH